MEEIFSNFQKRPTRTVHHIYVKFTRQCQVMDIVRKGMK